MSISLEDLRAFTAKCDPGQPLGGHDPLYVSLDEVRGSEGLTCIEALERAVLLRDESCQLFTGFLGTGKTTELRRLEARLSAANDLPTHVLYIPFEDYIDRYTPISIADILRVIAYALDREATQAEGDDPEKKPGYLKRFADFITQTDIELTKSHLNLYGTSLMLELKNNAEFRRRAEAVLMDRLQQFADEAFASMRNSVERLRRARGAHAKRVVVIADGLEKLTALRYEEREKMEAGVEAVFLSHSRLLHLPCHVIYTFPLWLRYRRADLGVGYDGEPLVLPMVKVAEVSGAPFEQGIAKLEQMVAGRVDTLRVFGTSPQFTLRPLLLASGGYLRDMLRMVRNLLMGARDFPVQPADTARVIDRLAEDYRRTLFATDLDILAKVAETHALPRGRRDDLEAFAEMLDRWFVLAYRNGEEWYDLHPLVRRDPMVQAKLKPIAMGRSS